MRIDLVACAALIVLLVGCRTDPEHPTGREAVGEIAGPAVVTVDGRTITAAEATEFAATREDATLDELVRRERLVEAALEGELDVSLARKRAMIQALLADEIEAKVGIDTVSEEQLDLQRRIARVELTPAWGFEVTSVRVGSLELIQHRAELTPERIEELDALVLETATRLYEQIPADDGVAAADALTTDWVDPAVRVELSRGLRIMDIEDAREASQGWVRGGQLAVELRNIEDGQKTPIIESSGVQLFAVRRARIERQPVDEDLLERTAVNRALAEGRKARLDKLLDELRDRTAVVKHPQLLEEGL